MNNQSKETHLKTYEIVDIVVGDTWQVYFCKTKSPSAQVYGQQLSDFGFGLRSPLILASTAFNMYID